MRSILLWVLGVPIPIVIIIALLFSDLAGELFFTGTVLIVLTGKGFLATP